jgi:hypothetical protein
LSYTGGKLIDDASQVVTFLGAAGTKQDYYNRAAERSISAQDVSRQLVISYNYDLPVGKGRMFLTHMPSALEAVIGGWQTNGIYTYRTGIPLQISNGVNQTNLGSPGQRPNNNGKSAKLNGSVEGRLNQYFDTSVFSVGSDFHIRQFLADVTRPARALAAQHRFLHLQELLDPGTADFAVPGRVLQRNEYSALGGSGNDGERGLRLRRDHQRVFAARLPDGVEADVLRSVGAYPFAGVSKKGTLLSREEGV